MPTSRLSAATVLAAALLAGLSACKQKPDHDDGDSLPREVVPEPMPVEPITPQVTTEPNPVPSLAPETPAQPLSRNDAPRPVQQT